MYTGRMGPGKYYLAVDLGMRGFVAEKRPERRGNGCGRVVRCGWQKGIAAGSSKREVKR